MAKIGCFPFLYYVKKLTRCKTSRFETWSDQNFLRTPQTDHVSNFEVFRTVALAYSVGRGFRALLTEQHGRGSAQPMHGASQWLIGEVPADMQDRRE